MYPIKKQYSKQWHGIQWKNLNKLYGVYSYAYIYQPQSVYLLLKDHHMMIFSLIFFICIQKELFH